MIDCLATSLLFFSNTTFIIPFIILGFIWIDNKIFYHAVCLVILCMALNVALKISFAIPLNPSLGKEGFAFPSGHMQLATVLYTWLASRLKAKWVTILVIFLLAGIAISLNYYSYHNYYDVIAATIVGLLLVIFYYQFLLKWPNFSAIIVFCLVTLLLVYIRLWQGKIQQFLWFPYFAFIGMALAENGINEKANWSAMSKLFISIIFLSFAMTVYSVFSLFFPPTLYPCIFQTQGLILGFILPYSNIWRLRLTEQFKR